MGVKTQKPAGLQPASADRQTGKWRRYQEFGWYSVKKKEVWMGHQRRWLLKTASHLLDRTTKNTTKYPDNTYQVGFYGVGMMIGSHTQKEPQLLVYNERAERISNH